MIVTAIIFAINSSGLFHWNFVDATLVTSSLIRSCQEGLNHGDGLLVGNKAAWHSKDVGIVVLACETGYRKAPTQSRTDALVLVESDVDALTAATHGDAGIALALLDSQSARMGKVGIVTTVLVVGTEVLTGNALPFKPKLDGFLDGITCMVATKCNRQAWFQN